MSEKKKAQETQQNEEQTSVEQEVVEEAVLNETEQKLEQLANENKELQDKLLRQMAEFDNFRKRTVREKAELYDDATAKCILQLLAVIDNFERALATPCEGNEDFKKGVQMIFDQLMQTLAGMGVSEIEALGKPFDPELHNAVSRIEDENFDENTVCQVYQKGFKLKDKVVRHAMVVVANS